MLIQPNKVFVSVFSPQSNNPLNHSKAAAMLVREGFQFQVVNGVYKGVKELVFLLSSTCIKQHKANVIIAMELGLLFNQEHVLEVGNDNMAILHTIGSGSEPVGVFHHVSEIEAILHTHYTYDPVTQRHYVITG